MMAENRSNERCFMEEYQLWFGRTIGRPWIHKEPLRLGNVPKGLGTPNYYCTASRDEEPYLLLCLYGRESYLAQARIWQNWRGMSSACPVYSLSLAIPHQQNHFVTGY